MLEILLINQSILEKYKHRLWRVHTHTHTQLHAHRRPCVSDCYLKHYLMMAKHSVMTFIVYFNVKYITLEP